MPDLIRGNLTALAADVEMQGGARALLLKVLRSTMFARVFHVAPSMCEHQRIFVVCQSQHRGSLTTDPSGMACAKPRLLHVSAASPFTTRWPLAPGY